jgi:hypothetical protein
MSTLAYAALTTRRDVAAPGSSSTSSPPGVKTYVDALAALVPSEVLTLHGLMLSATTKISGASTAISEPKTLAGAFVGLAVVAVGLYTVPRLIAKKWDRLDLLRMMIPPLAFVGWTMLQRSTAFDAVLEVCQRTVPDGTRTVVALFLAVVLAGAASALAYRADQKPPAPRVLPAAPAKP